MKRKIYFFVPIMLALTIIISNITSLISISEDISDKVFRLHIIANSDDDFDQNLKLLVRDDILKLSNEIYSDCKSIDDAKFETTCNLKLIEQTAQQTLAFYGSQYNVKAYVTRDYFDTRKYDNFILPAGIYDCLKIIIGKGTGHNWWCVMYPSVCLSGCVDDFDNALNEKEKNLVINKYIPKFKVVEMYEYIKYKVNKKE